MATTQPFLTSFRSFVGPGARSSHVAYKGSQEFQVSERPGELLGSQPGKVASLGD